MGRLRAKDFHLLFGALSELYRLGTHEEWVGHLLPTLRTLIPSDRATYNELRYGAHNHFVVRDDTLDSSFLRSMLPVFEAYGTQHPSAEYIRKTRTKEAVRWSDVVPFHLFERTPLYNEYFTRLRTKAQLGIPLSVGPSFLIPVAVNRCHGDFTDRDRLMLTLLGPHLTQSFLNARLLTRLKKRYHTMESAVEDGRHGILELGPKESIRWATPRVSHWLALYWPETERQRDRLPETIAQWLRREEAELGGAKHVHVPQRPLVVERGPHTLRVRLLREGARRLLFFDETTDGVDVERLRRTGLGRRESEVLHWVAGGKTNQDIAVIMDISVKTVKKHLERIFEKLGVESRTAATARALELCHL
ncbi:helix-turn-helix transcriptional regulator [Nitrospira moscoviensis]|uniref:HTH luxR-type domain-containing protein n=1 Tax=Nitrospira moscoviensis TaxID=42253 RepID=A0A0K2GF79_NITMO|nr:helix-turn-helix transcriptional regulator [Nitrospira moscoviensis]ALA59613.1 hypothetical protein NITMOv2_3216 [Nitrospira moscoviensis]